MLILNPQTGHISPQFHVAFINNFKTVSHMVAGTVPPNWAKLVHLSSECATFKNFKLSDKWNKPHLRTETDAGGKAF